MIPAKTAKPIEMPFGELTRVGPGNHVLDGGLDPRKGRDNFWGLSAPDLQRGRGNFSGLSTSLKSIGGLCIGVRKNG